MNWNESITILLSVAAFLFSLWSFFVDRTRSRREATIHAFDALEEQVFSKNDYKKLPVRAGEDISTGKKDGHWKEATHCLSLIEHFCVGVQMNTYDINALNRLAGGFIIEQYRFWTPIINTKRNRDSNSAMKHYDEFESVAKRLCKMRKQPWED